MKLTKTLIVGLVLLTLMSGIGAGLGVAYPYLSIFFGDQDRRDLGRDRRALEWIENDDGDAAQTRAVIGAAVAGALTIVAILSIDSRKRHRK